MDDSQPKIISFATGLFGGGSDQSLFNLAHPSMYDNFRQFLFILPPLFFFAAKVLDSVFRKFTIRPLTTAIYAIVLLPGILAGIWLHLYE